MGITCFSKSPSKTLMWSHYADKHNGICLGFSFEKKLEEGVMQLEIKYTDKIEPVRYFKETVFSIYNWVFTKSKVWDYEEEVRRVYVKKNGLIDFKKNDLREIYFGLGVSEDQIQYFLEMLKINKFANVSNKKRMKMNPKTFDLIEDHI